MSKSVIKKMKDRGQVSDRQKDLEELQRAVQDRAYYSLAILGMGFVRNGSGRFLNIRTTTELTRG